MRKAETVIYADILFIINFSMDFISLSAAATLGAREKKTLKMIIASLLGALYGVLATVSNLQGTLQFVLAFLVGASMCTIAFGFSGGILALARQYIIFWGASALLAGIMTFILSYSKKASHTGYLQLIPASAIVIYFIIRSVSKKISCSFFEIEIIYNKRKASFSALCDSGNLMREPFSNLPVILVSKDVLHTVFTHRQLQALCTSELEYLAENDIKFRLIPRKTAADEELICAFIPDTVTVKSGKSSIKRKCAIGVLSCKKDHFAGYSATAPTILAP